MPANRNEEIKDVYTESWYQRSWRPMMAYLYLILCFLDYGVRPAINFELLNKFNLVEVVNNIRELDPMVQVQIIETLRNDEAIPPILSEFVHISFGAILGVAAFTRGREKQDRVRESGPYATEPPRRRKKQIDQSPSDESDGDSEEGLG